MIKQIFTLLLTSFIANVSFAQTGSANQKPVQKFYVTVNGRQYSTYEGDTLKAEGREIIIRAANYLTFDYGALHFDYPGYFVYNFEEEEGYKNWTLSGNDFVIMYFELEAEVELSAFVKELVNKFGKKNCTLSKIKIKLGTLELEGTRIDVVLIETRLTQDVYSIKANDGKTHLMLFQDTKGDDGSGSPDSVIAMEIINETFILK